MSDFTWLDVITLPLAMIGGITVAGWLFPTAIQICN